MCVFSSCADLSTYGAGDRRLTTGASPFEQCLWRPHGWVMGTWPAEGHCPPLGWSFGSAQAEPSFKGKLHVSSPCEIGVFTRGPNKPRGDGSPAPQQDSLFNPKPAATTVTCDPVQCEHCCDGRSWILTGAGGGGQGSHTCRHQGFHPQKHFLHPHALPQ